MGELQHGVYDNECEDLNEEELNAFYGFEEDGEFQGLDESSNQSDENDNNNNGNLEELEMNEEWIESEDEDEVVNLCFIKLLT